MADKSADVALTDDQRIPSAIAEDLNDKAPSLFDDDTLASLTSFDAAMAAFGDTPPESITDYGNGFTLCDDKRTLIGVPFIIVQWRFNGGTYGVFVSAAIVTEDGRKLILNDGSTGIQDQLRQVTEKRIGDGHSHPRMGLVCKDGLRMSEYMYDDPKNGPTPAQTFYLAN